MVLKRDEIGQFLGVKHIELMTEDKANKKKERRKGSEESDVKAKCGTRLFFNRAI